MFDIFKRDIKIGDKVKLYLTTGKEPEGAVMEIGDSFVLLRGDDNIQNRFFDKLIGGWDIIIQKMDQQNDNLPNISKPDATSILSSVNKELLLSKSNSLLKSLDKSILSQIIKSNANIIQSSINKCIAQNSKYKAISILKTRIIDDYLLETLNEFKPGSSIPVYININERNIDNIYAYAVTIPKSIENLIHSLISLINVEDYVKVDLLISILRLHINGNKYLGSIISEMKKILVNKNGPKVISSAVTSDDLFPYRDQEYLTSTGYSNTSRIFDLDIEEHVFSSPELIKTNNHITLEIAKIVYRTAKKERGGDLKEIYSLYLEAAKAFKEINFSGPEYFDSILQYAISKANYLYSFFKNKAIQSSSNFIELSKVKNAACTYLSEGIKMLKDNLDKTVILFNNYLKLQIASFYLKNEIPVNYEKIFKYSFSETIGVLLDSKTAEMEQIFIKSILEYDIFSTPNWMRISNSKYFESLNKNWQYDSRSNKNISQLLGDEKIDYPDDVNIFLKNILFKRHILVNEVEEIITHINSTHFDPINFLEIHDLFKSLEKYFYILSDNDKEIILAISQIMQNLLPYINRNQTEKNTILLRANVSIERQLKFIKGNISFLGRCFFYGLIYKWDEEIINFLHEKNSHGFPSLKIEIDPPYYLESENEYTAPLIIKNEGGVTAEGFILNFRLTTTDLSYFIDIVYNSEGEISPANQFENIVVFPKELFLNSGPIQLTIDAQAKYQGKSLPVKTFEYTLEKEPKSSLTYEDIPWKDGPVPPETLFKGRSGLINDLCHHYLSVDRVKPYILYGLTRTGKSSILEYLESNIEGKKFFDSESNYQIITFRWNLQEISNNSSAIEFYTDILNSRMYKVIKDRFEEMRGGGFDFVINDKGQFSDLRRILEFLKENGFYAMIFIDELSFISELIDRKIIGPGFLAALREYSLTGLASFIFAGTYDIKKLISDEKYGITGQLVHAINYQVDSIGADASRDLISVINSKLTFTEDAVEHILHLSGRIPYFIQIICKSCGDYAVEKGRRYIGYPELEKVVRILIGKEESKNSLVTRLPEGKFSNNQKSTSDPVEVNVLISSIAALNKENILPRGVGFHELEKLWHGKNLSSYKSMLAASIQNLLEKKILIQEEEDGLPIYKFAVDLFRRWWYNHHQDIDLELTTLRQ